jgi:hypothetical protein
VRRAAAVVASVVAALAASAAFAKAPKPADEATVEEICEQARQAIKKGAEAERNPYKDAIDKYRDKSKTPLADWKPVVDIINDAKTAELQSYRDDAVVALLERFVEGDKDPQVRSVRREVAQSLIDLMKADPKKDATGLSAIEKIINNWWRQDNLTSFKFHAKDSAQDRKKSYDKLKKWLKGD